jgi:aryl-alcohol dehydrogenase-like predicted oxidoreductase
VLAALDTVAAAHKATLAQVALAWLMARPSVTAPIASATTTDQMNELSPAAQLKLTAEDMKTLHAA